MEIPGSVNKQQSLNVDVPKRRILSNNPKRRILNISEKIELIKVIDQSPNKRKEIAANYGIPINTLSTIYSNRERFLQQSQSGLSNLNKMRMRMSTYPDIEAVLIDRYKKNQALSADGKSTSCSLRLMALEVAKSLGYQDFTASNGWLERFKIRHNLKFRRNKRKKTSSQSMDNNDNLSFNLNDSYASLNGNSSEAEYIGDSESNIVWENVSNPVMELTEVKEEYDDSCNLDYESHNSILPHSPDHELKPKVLPQEIHPTETQVIHQNLEVPPSYQNFQRKFCSVTIQNVEEAFNIIKCYIESHRDNVNERTQEAMKELKKFISAEKDKKTQSKITDYFNFCLT